MVYFTGDIHRYVNKLLRNLDYLNIPHKSNQIIVLLGDVGINYMLDMSDKVEKEKLQSSGRTYFCIQGNHELRPENIDSYKIIIGKKINYKDDKILLKINKDDFFRRFVEIERCIDEAIISQNYSEINVYYNHFYSLTSFEFVKIQLFPVEFKGEYYEGEDFVMETNVDQILGSLMTFYICYELKMCESISYAAENVLRSQITSSALDKIKEREEEMKHEEIKSKKEKSILKSVENFKKLL